jgi:general secretion pathway protein M
LLLALFLIVVAEMLVMPLWSLYQSRQRTMVAMHEDAYRFERVADGGQAHALLIERLRRHRSQEGLAFSQPNPGQASAALQQRLKALVADSGGKLLSIQSLLDTDANAYRQIGARARIKATADTLPEILYAIESAHPYLFVDELTITRSALRRSRRKAPIEVSLDLQLTVSGYAEHEGGR